MGPSRVEAYGLVETIHRHGPKKIRKSKIFHISQKKEGKKQDPKEAGERSEPRKFVVFGRKTVPK